MLGGGVLGPRLPRGSKLPSPGVRFSGEVKKHFNIKMFFFPPGKAPPGTGGAWGRGRGGAWVPQARAPGIGFVLGSGGVSEFLPHHLTTSSF